MQFSYNWLQSFFKKKLPRPEKLVEILTMYSFEVNEVKKERGDFILDIDVLPNRGPDCFSHLGIARECAILTKSKIKNPRRSRFATLRGRQKSKIIEDKKLKTKNFIQIEVKDQRACPRYTARVITEVKVGPSPKYIRERLIVCGLRPINNIVDIVNYVMLEIGQPLHAFDCEKLEGRKIIVRFAKKGERIVTLDEEKYDLDENILVIADAEKPVAIAGIKGGKETGVDKKTRIVVLESANFNPRAIRRGSKRIDLKTDASLRFEHGIDPNLTEFAIDRAAYLIHQLAGGKITQGLIDFYPKKVLPKIIKLDLDYLESLLGVKIPTKEIKSILERLNFKILNTPKQSFQDATGQAKYLLVEVPTFRLDISIPEDLIEEIGRIYGYERIPSIFPIVSLIPPQRNLDMFWEDRVKDILKEAGFTEVYNYSFISDKDAEIFGTQRLIEIENPTSSEFQYLRPSLIPNLLKNIQKNQPYFKEIKIFELGKIFRKIGKKNKEKGMLTGGILGDAFYEAKGAIDLLLNKLGISNVWYDEYQPTPEESKISLWHLQKCAEIKINHEEIGFLGEISPKILDELKIENKVIIFDIDFEKLTKLASEEQEYRPLSKYPAAIRDLAVLVPLEVRVEEVLNKIETAGGTLLRDVDLFDIYEGEELPEGKKNFAFHLIFQAEDHTLTSEEINKIQQKIIKTLEKESEWQVRK